MTLQLVDAIAHLAAWATGTGIFVNVLDDLFVDARYLTCGGDRRASRVLTEKALRAVPPKRIAIVLPAWKEADVIEQMLEHNIARIDYPRDRYDVFCGTYQNDPQTQERVDAIARRFRNVHKVVVPHDGPTSKADCLNWVYQGVILAEQTSGRRFDILLMHDAEDVVHPLALRLYSMLIPPYELVQTPVFSLPLPTRRLVSGTYIDEFAEHHLKDMRVREVIGGLVPSAGVGTAFARDTFEQLAVAHGQRPFNVESLTEDYEIALKLRLANRKAHFACHTVERIEGGKRREEFIATREYFPADFRASVRQRSRWILGIALQTWGQIGWRGALPVLYCLWRDRKSVFTNALLLCAYALALYVVGRLALARVTGVPWASTHVVSPGSLLAWLLTFNLAAAAWRAGMKARFVWRLYGPAHALLTPLRLLLANFICILATVRAVGQYTAHRVAGRPLRWLKTAHDFPAFERLVSARCLLGEYLLDQRALSAEELEEALALQRATGAPLGEVLTTAGMASPSVVTRALGRELDVPTADPDPTAAPMALLMRVPEQLAEELDILPLEERAGLVVVASASPLDDAARARLQAAVGAPVEVRLAPGAKLREARERAYRRLVHGDIEPSRTQSCPDVMPGRDEVDRRSVARLGIAFCAFHGVLPLRAVVRARRRVLCAAPLH
ncbi:MAG TPA: glycosyl transferase family protein, partial [Polyangiaceae bacterium]